MYRFLRHKVMKRENCLEKSLKIIMIKCTQLLSTNLLIFDEKGIGHTVADSYFSSFFSTAATRKTYVNTNVLNIWKERDRENEWFACPFYIATLIIEMSICVKIKDSRQYGFEAKTMHARAIEQKFKGHIERAIFLPRSFAASCVISKLIFHGRLTFSRHRENGCTTKVAVTVVTGSANAPLLA